jgi:hypothetical protein
MSLAAPLIRFLECLKTFRPGSNNDLRAYLDKAIDGAISDAQQEWQSKGFSGLDTRKKLLRRLIAETGALMPTAASVRSGYGRRCFSAGGAGRSTQAQSEISCKQRAADGGWISQFEENTKMTAVKRAERPANPAHSSVTSIPLPLPWTEPFKAAVREMR